MNKSNFQTFLNKYLVNDLSEKQCMELEKYVQNDAHLASQYAQVKNLKIQLEKSVNKYKKQNYSFDLASEIIVQKMSQPKHSYWKWAYGFVLGLLLMAGIIIIHHVALRYNIAQKNDLDIPWKILSQNMDQAEVQYSFHPSLYSIKPAKTIPPYPGVKLSNLGVPARPRIVGIRKSIIKRQEGS